MTKKIYIGNDHAGFKLKLKLRKFLEQNKINFEDLGNLEYNKQDDYPDYAFKVCKKINNNSLGILICGTGHGMNIAANKFKNIRATICWNEKITKYAKLHNNINVICLPGKFIDEKTAIKIIKKFLNTKFSHEKRHVRRLNKIKKLK